MGLNLRETKAVIIIFALGLYWYGWREGIKEARSVSQTWVTIIWIGGLLALPFFTYRYWRKGLVPMVFTYAGAILFLLVKSYNG